jgi:hypothetical protein
MRRSAPNAAAAASDLEWARANNTLGVYGRRLNLQTVATAPAEAMLAAMRRASSRVRSFAADSLVAGEHLFRNVPTFSRLHVFGRGLGRVTRWVGIAPDWPSYRICARRRAAIASVATPPPSLLTPTAAAAAALRQPRAAPRCSSSLIVENIKRRQADV